MHDFCIKELSGSNLEQELAYIGFDSSYIHKATEKFKYKNFKIYSLSCAQANIIKQTALTVGADCATNRNVISGNAGISDVILGGSIAQILKIAAKLQFQPFGLKELGIKISQKLAEKTLSCNRTKIMGILNITPDSFSDGGSFFKFEDAIRHLEELINDGADIIDIGAETTKPGATATPAQEQLKRLLPVLKYIQSNNLKIPISIDTRCAETAAECINLGANIINDVSGFDFDPKMINVIKQNPHVKVIIQHSRGIPENMQNEVNTKYDNLMDEIFINLQNKINLAIANNIKLGNIIIDPGIGFGKTRKQNFEILQRWQELRTIGCPILIGLSRKSLLNMSKSSNEDKDMYSLALDSILISQNIDYIRVHNVKIHKKLQEIMLQN